MSVRNGIDSLQPWVKAVGIVGVPGLIAIYLVYVLATGFPDALAAHARESKTDSARVLRVLQQICVNTSDNQSSRDACFSITKDQ
jgi:hypothetical protein